MLSIIVAIAKNNVIGKDNKLIWHLPEDLKRFKELTIGKTIIMGRKTFESLGRVLPNRKHIVLTQNREFKYDNPQVEVINDIEEIKQYIEDKEENFVIGGATIYKMLMPYTNKMYITKIDKEFLGDTFFPEINKEEWKLAEEKKGITDEKNPYRYEYITYVRTNKI
ncbi:MAG: dihydrofolate reductase [Clostridia bacterium]|nr:dihydrofolate reductase [Clostridia bacterium]